MPGLRRLQPAAEKRFRATHASVGTADMNSLVSPLSAFSPLLFFFVALLSLLQRQKKCQEPPTYLQPLRGNSSNLFNTTLPLHSDHVLLPCQSLLGFQKLERAATELAEILFEHFLELLGNKKKKKFCRCSFSGLVFQMCCVIRTANDKEGSQTVQPLSEAPFTSSVISLSLSGVSLFIHKSCDSSRWQTSQFRQSPYVQSTPSLQCPCS